MALRIPRKGAKEAEPSSVASVLRRVFLVALFGFTAWHLQVLRPLESVDTNKASRTEPAKAAKTPPTKQPPAQWWNEYIEKSKAQGPLNIPPFPIQATTGNWANDQAIIEILEHYGVKSQVHKKLTIIDIGLPTESITFAKHGYLTESFEARTKGIKEVNDAIAQEPISVQEHIHLHHSALSNVSNTTLEIFDANDSSSLLESAVSSWPETRKFQKHGGKKETVPVNLLDSFIGPDQEEVVAMKIDTQGVEPEIFMGSYNLFHQQPSLVLVLTEYCARLRPYDELSQGPHLLNGLGFKCYIKANGQETPSPFVLDQNAKFVGDLVCIHEERAKKFSSQINQTMN